jgi:CheY-like chemotaxis protein
MADILVIEDDQQMRRLINRILRNGGHTVREAENGRLGIAEFQRQRPALVISDLLMPDMEGIETIRALRGEVGEDEVPIIAISGGSDPIYLQAAGKLGATATLRKPFSADELLQLVDGLLGQ